MTEKYIDQRYVPRSRRAVLAVASAVLVAATGAGCAVESGETPRGEVSGRYVPEDVKTREYKISTIEQKLGELAVKSAGGMSRYDRDAFGSGWSETGDCDTRNEVLQRDLADEKLARDGCRVLSGVLKDPYTGERILFKSGRTTSDDVQIDHVVALGDAWRSGASRLSAAERKKIANDPLNLAAVDGPTNTEKSDSNAASWLPPNRGYRCAYVARQILVKDEYQLSVTPAEYRALNDVLVACPGETIAVPDEQIDY